MTADMTIIKSVIELVWAFMGQKFIFLGYSISILNVIVSLALIGILGMLIAIPRYLVKGF